MSLRIHPRLAWQTVGEETVIVDVEAGRMLGLSEVGSCLWPLLESCDEAQLVAALVEHFEVDVQTATRDIRGFLQDLRERGLIEAG
jgi:hypothetical protein